VFSDSSRYAKLPSVEAEDKQGRKVNAVVLRRLPFAPGVPYVVKGHDRLDVMAQRRYKDPTLFWHIADANTELEANELVETPARTILVPEK
jgi:hypothetical protein